MSNQLRQYATPVTIYTEAPTPAQSNAVIANCMAHECDESPYVAEGAGIVVGYTITDEPADIGEGTSLDARERASLFP